MLNHRKIYSLLLIGIMLCMASSSDAQTRDFRSWWNAGISKGITKDIDASLKLGQRFRQNSMQYDRSMATVSLEYDLPKGFALEGGYRYILLRDERRNFISRYRLHGDATYSYRFDRLRIGFRERIQYGFDDLNSINAYYFDKLTSRSRVSFKYDIFGSPLSLQTSYEVFLNINTVSGLLVTDHRIRAGIEYVLSDRTQLDIYYMLNHEANSNAPLQSHVLLVTLGYNL